jgi:hypothetical protein
MTGFVRVFRRLPGLAPWESVRRCATQIIGSDSPSNLKRGNKVESYRRNCGRLTTPDTRGFCAVLGSLFETEAETVFPRSRRSGFVLDMTSFLHLADNFRFVPVQHAAEPVRAFTPF